jgi:hypothetical protein
MITKQTSKEGSTAWAIGFRPGRRDDRTVIINARSHRDAAGYLVPTPGAGAVQAQFAALFRSPEPLYSAY